MQKKAVKTSLLLAVSLSLAQAVAGNIGFNLALNGDRVQVALVGDTAAYYPELFRLHPDGQWQALPTADGKLGPIELAAGRQFEARWTPLPADVLSQPLAKLQPVMVRFFDQAGVAFGQMSFFQTPPMTETPVQVAYSDGVLSLSPPVPAGSVRATWVLAPREEGIGAITGAVAFRHTQPPAQKIDWRQGATVQSLSLGQAAPSAILLHEDAEGRFTQQIVAAGKAREQQKRGAWLNAPWFYPLAGVAGLGAVFALFWGWKRRAVTG